MKFSKVLLASGIAALAFASIAAAATFNVNLTVGSTGADVSALQNALLAGGYSIPAISSGVANTGYFGSQTKSAVMAYQSANSIPNTGFVGPLTRASLNAGGGVAVSPATCPLGYTCTANNVVAPVCPLGYTCVSNTPGAALITGTNGTITTPGVEGILTVTQGPISNTVVNVGQTQVPVLAIRAQAQNSDIAIQRITLNLGTNTKIYNKIYSTLYVTTGGTVIATIPLNSSTVVQNGSNYDVTLSGFSSVVSKGTYKDFVIKADVYSAIDSGNRPGPYTIALESTNPVRGIDGAGITQYGGGPTVSQSISINASLADNSIANVSSNSATPQTNSIPVTDTTNGQYLQLPVLTFDVGAQNDSLHLHQVQVAIGGTGTGTTSAAYLYQGSTQVSSASVTGGVATFSNIVDGTPGASIPVNTTVTYTVKVDVTGVTLGSLTVIPSLVVGSSNTIIYNSQDSTVNTFNGSAPGFTTTVLGKGPAFALASAPTISVSGTNQSGSTNSTSTVTATFNLNIQAVGSNVYLSSQASSTNKMFIFKVFNGAGSDVTSNLVNPSSGFIIPSAGVIVVNQPANSFYVPQQNSAQIGNVTFQFAGKDNTGTPLTAGPYSVEIQQINWSASAAGVATSTTVFDGLSAWRTGGINP
jgi:hypothetical protein